MHAITAPPVVETSDRLGFTLFIAIAAHAIVVLGVTFAPHERARELVSTLDIVLVQHESEVEPAPEASFEGAAHRTGEPYLFVDLRGAPEGHWLRGTYTSVALGRLENVAPWREVVDAFFFIDSAEPVTYLPR